MSEHDWKNETRQNNHQHLKSEEQLFSQVDS